MWYISTSLLLLLFQFGITQHDFSTGNPATFGIKNPYKTGISPEVGRSAVSFHPPPNIPRPDIAYQRITIGRTDFKYWPQKPTNDTEAYRPAKALFTIRNLGRNRTASASSSAGTMTSITTNRKQDTLRVSQNVPLCRDNNRGTSSTSSGQQESSFAINSKKPPGNQEYQSVSTKTPGPPSGSNNSEQQTAMSYPISTQNTACDDVECGKFASLNKKIREDIAVSDLSSTTTINSNQEKGTETVHHDESQQNSTTSEKVSTESLEIGEQEVTAGCVNVIRILPKSGSSRKQQQQYVSSTSPTSVLTTAIITAPTQHQKLCPPCLVDNVNAVEYRVTEKQDSDSTVPEDTDAFFSKTDQQPVPFASFADRVLPTTPAYIPQGIYKVQQSTIRNTISTVVSEEVTPQIEISQEAVPRADITPPQPLSELTTTEVKAASFAAGTLSSRTPVNGYWPTEEKQKGDDEEVPENEYGSDTPTIIRSTVRNNVPYLKILSIETPPLATKPEMPVAELQKLPCVNVQSSSKQISDNTAEIGSKGFQKTIASALDSDRETTVLEKIKNSFGRVKQASLTPSKKQHDRNSISEMGLAPPFDKLVVRPRIQSLTPFRNSEKNQTNVSKEASQLNKHLSSEERTDSGVFTRFGSETARSNTHKIPTLVEQKEMINTDSSDLKDSESLSKYGSYRQTESISSQSGWNKSPGFSPLRSSLSFVRITNSQPYTFAGTTFAPTGTAVDGPLQTFSIGEAVNTTKGKKDFGISEQKAGSLQVTASSEKQSSLTEQFLKQQHSLSRSYTEVTVNISGKAQGTNNPEKQSIATNDAVAIQVMPTETIRETQDRGTLSIKISPEFVEQQVNGHQAELYLNTQQVSHGKKGSKTKSRFELYPFKSINEWQKMLPPVTTLLPPLSQSTIDLTSSSNNKESLKSKKTEASSSSARSAIETAKKDVISNKEQNMTVPKNLSKEIPERIHAIEQAGSKVGSTGNGFDTRSQNVFSKANASSEEDEEIETLNGQTDDIDSYDSYEKMPPGFGPEQQGHSIPAPSIRPVSVKAAAAGAEIPFIDEQTMSVERQPLVPVSPVAPAETGPLVALPVLDSQTSNRAPSISDSTFVSNAIVPNISVHLLIPSATTFSATPTVSTASSTFISVPDSSVSGSSITVPTPLSPIPSAASLSAVEGIPLGSLSTAQTIIPHERLGFESATGNDNSGSGPLLHGGRGRPQGSLETILNYSKKKDKNDTEAAVIADAGQQDLQSVLRSSSISSSVQVRSPDLSNTVPLRPISETSANEVGQIEAPPDDSFDTNNDIGDVALENSYNEELEGDINLERSLLPPVPDTSAEYSGPAVPHLLKVSVPASRIEQEENDYDTMPRAAVVSRGVVSTAPPPVRLPLVSAAPRHDIIVEAKQIEPLQAVSANNQPRPAPRVLSQQLPNLAHLPRYISQPLNRVPYETYLPIEATYTGLPRSAGAIPLSASNLGGGCCGSGSGCCSGGGFGGGPGGFDGSCSPSCLSPLCCCCCCCCCTVYCFPTFSLCPLFCSPSCCPARA